jgi:hypothetical protein
VEAACESANISESNFSYEVTITPNPVMDFLFISYSEELVINEIVIYSHMGQEVLQPNPFSNTLDVSSLKNGVYFAEIKTNISTITKKFIIGRFH